MTGPSNVHRSMPSFFSSMSSSLTDGSQMCVLVQEQTYLIEAIQRLFEHLVNGEKWCGRSLTRKSDGCYSINEILTVTGVLDEGASLSPESSSSPAHISQDFDDHSSTQPNCSLLEHRRTSKDITSSSQSWGDGIVIGDDTESVIEADIVDYNHYNSMYNLADYLEFDLISNSEELKIALGLESIDWQEANLC